jgi:hypothetical protein
MTELIRAVWEYPKETPLPFLLLAAGILFTLLGAAGGIKNRITLDKIGRGLVTIVGLAMLGTWGYIYFRPPHEEISRLHSASLSHFEKWKSSDTDGILSCCHFSPGKGMKSCLGKSNLTKEEVKKELDSHPVFTERGATQDLDAVTVGCNFEESKPGEQYFVQISYTYLLTGGPKKKQGARRLSLRWTNLAGEWKISEISETNFPMDCANERRAAMR